VRFSEDDPLKRSTTPVLGAAFEMKRTLDVNDGWRGDDGSITLTAPDTDIVAQRRLPIHPYSRRNLTVEDIQPIYFGTWPRS
jgi:hypothetical protein